MRKYGLACDNLLSAQVVTADGLVLNASSVENQDLFWGLRGGGGNFGVVTSFEFKLYPLDNILGGLLIYPLDVAKQVFRVYREVAAGAPDELGSACALATHPEAGPIAGIIICYSGAVNEGEKLLEPLRDLKPIIADQISQCAYSVVQEIAGNFNPHGIRNYWKSNSLLDLSDELIELVVDRFREVPAPYTHVAFEHFGGAVARVPEHATACHSRTWPFDFLIAGMWDDPNDDDRNINWVRDLWSDLRAFAAEGAYTNYMAPEMQERSGELRRAYGDETYFRLQALKRQYDPTNLFRLNQNIKPVESKRDQS